jgi:hypothetical protein
VQRNLAQGNALGLEIPTPILALKGQHKGPPFTLPFQGERKKGGFLDPARWAGLNYFGLSGHPFIL